jgi:hypothetical protein
MTYNQYDWIFHVLTPRLSWNVDLAIGIGLVRPVMCFQKSGTHVASATSS